MNVDKKITLIFVLLACLFYFVVDLVAFEPRTYFPDENYYISLAKNLAETGELKHPTSGHRAFVMPLPSALYAAIYKIFPNDETMIIVARMVQAILLILSAIGIYVITYMIFQSRLTAMFSMIATLFYPSLVAYQATLMSESIFIFFLIWGFAFLYLWQGQKKLFWLCFSVISFCLSVYTRPVFTAVTPILVACATISMGDSFSQKIKYVVASCIIFCVCLAPWWVRNYRIFDTFVPFTLSTGITLYLGNNPANTTASIDPGETGADPKELAEIYALGDELAISKAFGEKAKAYIIENPGTFARNAWLKFKRFWNFTSNYDAPAHQSFFFKAYNASLLLSWLPIFCLAVISFALNWQMWRKLMPIYCLIAYFTFIHVVVIASLRYRLPIEPFFIVMASDTVRRVWEYFEGARKHDVAFNK